jgi:hypothetical protein
LNSSAEFGNCRQPTRIPLRPETATGRDEPEENAMTWETPEYTVIDVCAEVTGYLHRADED